MAHTVNDNGIAHSTDELGEDEAYVLFKDGVVIRLHTDALHRKAWPNKEHPKGWVGFFQCPSCGEVEY